MRYAITEIGCAALTGQVAGSDGAELAN